MKCNKCDFVLEENSNICPNCGNVITYEDIEEIEELDVDINENMAPPSLAVESENLTDGVTDISNAENVEIYEINPEEIKKEAEEIEVLEPDSSVQFTIPGVGEVVENADSVTGVVSEQDIEDKKNKFKLKIDLKGSVPALYFVIASVACLIVGVLVGKAIFSTSYIGVGTGPSNINTKVIANGKNNTTYLEGITYTIPKDYLYDKDNRGLLVYDKTGNVRMYLRLMLGSYDNMANAKTSIKETLKVNDLTINSIEEKKIDTKGSSYIIIEAQTSIGSNRLIAFRKYNNEKVFYMEIIDNTNNYNNDALKVLDDIINNVKETEGSTLEGIKVYDIADVAITASNEYKALNSN